MQILTSINITVYNATIINSNPPLTNNSKSQEKIQTYSIKKNGEGSYTICQQSRTFHNM